jgi:hypothetical protein
MSAGMVDGVTAVEGALTGVTGTSEAVSDADWVRLVNKFRRGALSILLIW